MSDTSHFRKKKILLVEDEADLLELFRSQFKEYGFAIATARNGVDALRKAKSLVPDLIVLDVMQPELSGFAVCEILRKDPVTASIPVLMVTGLTTQIARCVAVESGATEFVTKPISADELVSKVKDMFLKRAAGASAN